MLSSAMQTLAAKLEELDHQSSRPPPVDLWDAMIVIRRLCYCSGGHEMIRGNNSPRCLHCFARDVPSLAARAGEATPTIIRELRAKLKTLAQRCSLLYPEDDDRRWEASVAEPGYNARFFINVHGSDGSCKVERFARLPFSPGKEAFYDFGDGIEVVLFSVCYKISSGVFECECIEDASERTPLAELVSYWEGKGWKRAEEIATVTASSGTPPSC